MNRPRKNSSGRKAGEDAADARRRSLAGDLDVVALEHRREVVVLEGNGDLGLVVVPLASFPLMDPFESIVAVFTLPPLTSSRNWE